MRSGGRLYWVCQAAGWGSFLAYVLGAYLLTDHPIRIWDIASIVFFNGVLCPAITHGLRAWIHAHDWFQMSMGRLWLRAVAFVVVTAAVLTAGVGAGILATGGPGLPIQGALGIFAGFAWAFTGWLTIYFVVHARRRRDALQLQLTVVARDAQLRALRAQLNPHFLFNCLNSLRHLIVSNPGRAASMVTGLAELLRYSLESDRRDLVPLADELHVVDEYLELERVRFEERLRVERQIDPRALTVRIPPMLVQSLVDNAIKHGISDLPRGGVVRITATVSGSRLELAVLNTGRLKPSATDGGQGLTNARERLRLLYGGDASLTLTEIEAGDADGTASGRMTRAVVAIPMVTEARETRA